MTTNQFIAANIFAIWTIGFGVAILLVVYITQHRMKNPAKHDPIMTIAFIGMAIEIAAWGAHRLYFWIVRIRWGDEVSIWMMDHVWLTVIPLIAAAVGYAMMLAPYSSAIVGRAWPWCSAGVFAALWALGLMLA